MGGNYFAAPFFPVHKLLLMRDHNNFPLYPLIQRLQFDLLPKAIARRSFIANDIERDLLVTADENILAFLIKNLLNNAVEGTENSYISIKNTCSPRGCRISIQKNDMLSLRMAAQEVIGIRDAVELLGGFISAVPHKPGELCIIFPMQTQNRP
jgi:signal transduction histidine kinase